MEGNKQNLLQHTLIDCCSWEPTCCISHTRYRQGAYLLPLALSQIQAGWWDRENIVRNQSACWKPRESRPLPGDKVTAAPCRAGGSCSLRLGDVLQLIRCSAACAPQLNNWHLLKEKTKHTHQKHPNKPTSQTKIDTQSNRIAHCSLRKAFSNFLNVKIMFFFFFFTRK